MSDRGQDRAPRTKTGGGPGRPPRRRRALPRHHRAPRERATPALRVACAALAIAGCGRPGPPDITPDGERPPEPAAFACTPPYARFGQRAFRWADLDRGISCRAWLEQDECVLGVFRDCTQPAEAPREWRGRADGESIELDALYPLGNTLPRTPTCCLGPLVREEDAPAWASLACRRLDCRNPNDDDHLGLYLEDATDDAPSGRVDGSTAAPGPIVEAAASWLLIRGGDPTVDGLWSTDDLQTRRRAIAGGLALALSPSGEPWVLTASAVIDPSGVESPLSQTPLAIAATSSGAVVATIDRLVFVGLGGAPRSDRARGGEGTAAGLVASPAGQVYLLTQNPPTMAEVRPDLTETPPIDLSELVVGPPRHPTWLDDQVVFTGACHANATGEHCLYAYAPESGAVRRLGLTDGTRLGRPFARGADWWIPDEAGWIHVVEPVALRARLFARFETPPGLTRLIPDPRRPDVAWAINRTEALLWTVVASDGKD